MGDTGKSWAEVIKSSQATVGGGLLDTVTGWFKTDGAWSWWKILIGVAVLAFVVLFFTGWGLAWSRKSNSGTFFPMGQARRASGYNNTDPGIPATTNPWEKIQGQGLGSVVSNYVDTKDPKQLLSKALSQ